MSKTNEQYQQDLGNLLVQAGHSQHMVRALRQAIETENSKLNGLNQKIDKLKKDYYAAFPLQAVPPVPESKSEEVTTHDSSSPQNIPPAA